MRRVVQGCTHDTGAWISPWGEFGPADGDTEATEILAVSRLGEPGRAAFPHFVCTSQHASLHVSACEQVKWGDLGDAWVRTQVELDKTKTIQAV